MYYRHKIISSKEDFPVEVNLISLEGTSNYSLAKDMTIIWLLSGQLEVDLYDDSKCLLSDDLYILNQNTLYSLSSYKKSSLVEFKINREYCKGLYSNYNDLFFHLESDKSGDASYIKHLISKIVYSYYSHYDLYKDYLIDDLESLIKHIFENNSSTLDRNFKKDKNKERVCRIVSYIDSNYNLDIRLSHLAKKENLSNSHLSKLIKNFFGIPFQSYMNKYRLNKFVEKLVLEDDSIQNISKSVGFSSSNYMNRVFKEKYGISPRDYRSKFNSEIMAEDRKAIMYEIKKNTCVNLDFLQEQPRNLEDREEVAIDIDKNKGQLNKYWSGVINISNSNLLLYGAIQDRLRIIQEDIDFKYAKFKVSISNSKKNNLRLESLYRVIDFLLEIDLKPFIELYYERELIGLPSAEFLDIELENLDSLIRGLINRYGLDQVRSWNFEVSNLFYRSQKELDEETIRVMSGQYGLIWNTIKSIDKKIKLGFPIIYKSDKFDIKLAEDFLEFIESSFRTVDFISIDVFIEEFNGNELPFDIIECLDFRQILYNKFNKTYMDLRDLFNGKDLVNRKFYIFDWGRASGFFDYDVFTIDEFELDKIRQNLTLSHYHRGVLSGSSLVEEESLLPTIGGGAFFTNSGLKKFNYHLYYILAKLGEEIVEIGSNFIATKREDSVQILIYNYRDSDCICLKRQESRSDSYNRKLGLKNVELRVANLSGKYEITEYSLSREEGSAYYNWLKMGSPKILKSEEIRYLSGRGMPSMEIKELKIEEGDCFRETYLMPPYSLKFINMDKIF